MREREGERGGSKKETETDKQTVRKPGKERHTEKGRHRESNIRL